MADIMRIGSAVRVLLSVAMLAILLPRASRLLVPVWKPSTLAWLSAALLVTLAAVVLASLRWQRVLAALGTPTRLPSLLSHYLAGMFVSNFLPTTIGGDVVRASRLSATIGDSSRSIASVVLERLTGWVVLPVISLVTLAINPGLLRPPVVSASRLAITISLLALTLLVVVLGAASSGAVGRRLGHRLRFAGDLHLGLAGFRRRPGWAGEVLVVGFAYQLAMMLAAFLAARAVGLALSWTAVLAFMPAVAMVQVLPAPTVGGLGVREGAFVLFLHPLGVRADHAIALGLVIYALNLLVSLLGAPAFATGTRPARAVV